MLGTDLGYIHLQDPESGSYLSQASRGTIGDLVRPELWCVVAQAGRLSALLLDLLGPSPSGS